MIAKVLVKQKTSNDKIFDYLIDQNQIIKPLMLVEVPFRNRKIMAVVLSTTEKSHVATKKIIRPISTSPVLTTLQFELAKAIQDNFASSLSDSMFALIPTLNLKDYKSLKPQEPSSKQNKSANEFIQGALWERINYYIARDDSSTGQSLIILPEIEMISEAANIYKKLSDKKVFLWHSKISSEEKRKILNLLVTKQDITIISTRHGLLLPFTNLKNIFLDQPTSFAYFEDQEPYYNAYKLARIATKVYKNNLIIGDSIPDLLSYVAIKQEKLKFVELNNRLKISITGSLHKITSDLKLMGDLNRCKQIFVFGFFKDFHSMMCKDCRYQINCTKCKNKYFSSLENRCTNCQSSPPLKCLQCSSTRIIKSGNTINKLNEALTKSNIGKKFIIQDFSNLTKQNTLFEKVAIIPYFDFYANYPFVTFREKLFRLVMGLANLGIEQVWLSGEGIRELQFANLLKEKNWQRFLKIELETRRQSFLPPFSTAIKIEIRNKIDFKSIFSELKIDNFLEISQNVIYVFCENSKSIKTASALKNKLAAYAKVRIYPVEFA